MLKLASVFAPIPVVVGVKVLLVAAGPLAAAILASAADETHEEAYEAPD